MQVERTAAFGALLKRYRASAGLSQELLADQAGLSRRGIADLERGARRSPFGETVRRLADALRLADQDRAMLLNAARRSPDGQPGVPVGDVTRDLQADRTDPSANAMTGILRFPEDLTTFVGREQDVAGVETLLSAWDEPARLVTLTGAGGVGKSRLASRVGRRLRETYAGAVVWIELAPLSAPGLIAPTILAALGTCELPGRPAMETLVHALGQQTVLLVLDNCEHLLPACAELIQTVLRHCGQTRVLATSRESLPILGERVFRVPSLSVPVAVDGASPEELYQHAAVQLFVDRARLLEPRFRFDAESAGAVTANCVIAVRTSWDVVLNPVSFAQYSSASRSKI